MADVTVCKRDDYSGLDADKPVSANIGDSYSASDTGIKYIWDGSAWKNISVGQFVPRSVAAPDKQVGDFVTDGTWKVDGLDLSGIVPAGAISVRLLAEVADGVADSNFTIRKNAADVQNILTAKTQVANIYMSCPNDVMCDADRLFDYFGTNLVFTAINVTVLGWHI